MKRIAIDMDGVTADTVAHYLNRYNTEFNFRLTKEDLIGKNVSEVIDPAHIVKTRAYFQDSDFFAGIPVMPGSQEVVKELMTKYEVFITTAAMDVPCSFSAKFKWLQEYFPYIPSSHVVFCGDKSIVAADYLIDDDPRHFPQFRGEGILFSAGNNMHETRYRRVEDWQDVRQMFLG